MFSEPKMTDCFAVEELGLEAETKPVGGWSANRK